MRRTTPAILDGSNDEDGFAFVTKTLATTIDTLPTKGSFVVTLVALVDYPQESCHCGDGYGSYLDSSDTARIAALVFSGNSDHRYQVL